MATYDERVKHWNTFLDFAGEAMEQVYLLAHGKQAKHCRPDFGYLTDDEAQVARALIMLCIAIEARANHMIDEAAEKGRFKNLPDPKAAKESNNFKEKWANLAFWCGKLDRYKKTADVHKVVQEVHEYRDRLMHADFDKVKKLPSPAEALKLYERWIDAMKDMNAVLRDETPDPNIDKLKVFTLV